MSVEAQVKQGVIIFSEDGKVTCKYEVEMALMDLRWAAKHQPTTMTEKDYEGCLKRLKPHLIPTRNDSHLHSGYRMRGHSICEYCEYHYDVEDDPAGACIEDVAIYAHFEDSINGPIDAEDFLTGLRPVKEIVEGKVIVNCPSYKFDSDPSRSGSL